MNSDAYTAACKEAAKTKKEESYLVINMGYSMKLILPFAKGMVLLGSLNTAELFDDPYCSAPHITPIEKDKIVITVMSAVEYRQYQVAALLNVPVSDIKAHENEPS